MAKKNFLVDVDLNKNELQNAVLQNLAAAPGSAKSGQIWYDTSTNLIHFYNGTTAQAVGYLPIATDTVLGGIKVGSNISIDSSTGVLSVPDASTSTKGVIEIATDTEAVAGTDEVRAINAKQLNTKVAKNADIVAGTATKITYDEKGLVIAGTSLIASDVPDISATYVTNVRIGAANGVAGLGADGKVPSSQLPSYVDDIIELLTLSSSAPATCATGDKYYNSTSKLIYTATSTNTWGTTGETPDVGVIYVALDTNATYRWSGTDMINISNPISAASESTPGIAAIATQAEVNTGTNDTKIVTPLKLATYVSGIAKKFTATNGALTASGGVCIWTITNTLNTADVGIHVYEISTGAEVFTDNTVASGTVTIKFNSITDIAASTYKAVIIG